MCVYIYKGVYFILITKYQLLINNNNNNYFMLIINDSLNKRFCKKVFGFNISFFQKVLCIWHFHNIVNWSYSNIFYYFNIFIGTPHTQPNPFPFLFLFLFFFLPFFLTHMNQPFTFCLLSFSLSLLSSTYSATQPTSTHFFTLIFFILFRYFFVVFVAINLSKCSRAVDDNLPWLIKG